MCGRRTRVACALLAVVLLVMSLGGCGSQGKAEEVKVGVILPLSGSVAAVGTEIKKGIDFAAKQINESGGISSLDGAKVHLVYADSRGLPEVGLSEAERLILQEKVCGLIGAFQSSVTYTSTQAAEKYKVPYIVCISTADDITERGFKYTFRAIQPSSKDSEVRGDFLVEMGKKTGIPVKTLGVVYENTEWGQATAKTTKAAAAKRGIQVILDESYPANSSDLMSVVRKIAAAKPDALFLASYVSDGILLALGIAELQLDFICVETSGAEHSNPKFYPAVGKAGDYRCWLAPWHVKLLERKDWAKPINEAYKTEYGIDMSPYVACAFSDLYILVEAINKAGSADPQRIRDALAKIEITSGPAMIRSSGDKIYFDAKGQNPNASPVLVQTIGGEDWVVWPPEAATPGFTPVWPTPKWSERQ